MSNERILIVEDDDAIANGLALTLKLEGYDTVVCDDGGKALEKIQSYKPHLVLLDITLPNKNGLDVLGDLRELGDTTPVLVLSARQNEFDKVSALRLGADDYVTKPFSVIEVMARVRALLRRVALERGGAGPELKVQCGKLFIDEPRRQVLANGRVVDLTAKEFDLLAFFVRSPGQVFRRVQLLDQVWGFGFEGYEHTVNSHINRLRNKLHAADPGQDYIVTVWGVGYKLNDELAQGVAHGA